MSEPKKRGRPKKDVNGEVLKPFQVYLNEADSEQLEIVRSTNGLRSWGAAIRLLIQTSKPAEKNKE